MWKALTNGKTWRGEMINRRKDGSEYIELTLITPVKQADQRITHYLAIKQDITERKQAEEALRKAQRYARNLIETSLDPLVTISVDGKIMDVNKASESVTGYTREELIGSDFCDYFTEPDEARVGYQKVFAESAVTDYPLAIRHKSGHSIDVLYNATVYRNEAGDVEGVFAAARDITERKAIEDQIKQLAFYDTLTGLPNRRNLFDRLNYSIALSYREGRKLAVLMMDLDKFKAVNDTLGHSAGDELLKQVAARITLCLRDSDMVARLGGDEFVVVVERIGKPEDAAQVAVKIIEVLTVPFELSKNDDVQIGASIGISFYPQHGSSPATLVDCADAALYRAKANGRGCFSYYEN